MKKTCFPFYMLSLWGSDDIYMAESEKNTFDMLALFEGICYLCPHDG